MYDIVELDKFIQLGVPVRLDHTSYNDRAVMQAYGFYVKDMTESKCVAELMRMYQELTEKETK